MWDTGSSNSGDKMLTTSGSTQYLHPDYLQPLPTTLDAKKSPLALLAQTCSSIGKDTTPAKSLIPPIEKKDASKDKEQSSSRSKSESPGSKASPALDRSLSQPSAAEKREGGSSPSRSHSRGESPKSGFRAPVPKDTSMSSGSSKSPVSTSPSMLSKSAGPERETTSTTSVIQHPTPSTSSSQSNSRISINCGNVMLEVNHNESQSKSGLPHGAGSGSSSAATHLPGSLRPDPTQSLHPSGLPHHLGAAFPGMHLPLGVGHPMDAVHASSAYAAALSAHSSLLKPGSLPTSAALSSYMSYARIKTPTGANTLVPVCKDPYCSHCQATVQSAQLGSASACTSGCTQCTHDKSPHIPTSLSAAHSAALGSLPLYPGALGATPGMSSLALSSLYPHAFGALPAAHHGLPYVCNWVNGSDYCGKRFTTSEELLQHLRTHTSDSSALAAAAIPFAGLGLPSFQSHLAGGTAGTPGSISPNSALRAHYPRSLSPTSLLAASRFHPYKSALSSLSTPQAPAAPSLPVSLPSALGPHYPPYALYGQRLGAAVTP